MLNKNKHLWCKKSKILGSLLLLALFVVCTIFINTDGAYAATGINPEVNFQGRLLNSEGATVPDGYYNIEFKIYENGNGQSSGDSTGSPAGTLLWTEDYLNANSQGVEVVDGFLSVQLGSICSFSGGSCQGNTNLGVNWNTNPLWLSMNVAGTGASCSPFSACSPDGEMLPMKELSSDAYSLNSAELNGLSSSEFLQLAQGAQTDSSTASSIYINKTGASGDLVELQASGNDAFVITNDGDLTFGNNANHNISVTTAGSGVSGKSLTLTAGAAGSGGSALTGGSLSLQGGAGGGTNGNGGNVSLDAGQANGSGTNGTLSLGSQYASTVTIGNSSSTTTLQGTVNVSGPATFSDLLTANDGVTIAANKNLTLSSGIGTYSQTYVSTATGTDNVATWTVSNGNTGSTLTTVNAHNIALAGSPNSSGSDNVTNGVNFANVTPETGNTFNALNFGSGYSSLLQYGGNSLINGSGILQNAAIGSSTDYSSLNEVGALTSGSIASGFGTISTGNNITTTTEVQGGTVNATTNLDLNGVSINNTGTLSNVAYLPATTQTFTGANTFSASGTALSVTNNATISGTGTIGTLSVTSNGTVGGTLGITGLTTASGGLTVAGGQNLTLSSGIGTYSQTYVSTATGTDNVATWTVSNGNTGSTLTTVNAHNIALAGSPNSSGSDNVTNGVNFANVTPETGNTFNALNFGSGYSSLLQYGGNSLINGSGILQNAAIGSSTDYSSLNEVGALTSGSIASGFGTISTGNNITTTTEVQGGTVNATTNLDLNGVSINNTGTLSNVAYLPATTQTFTGANTFSASGTALSVTNNATISGTGTIGTLSVTSNGTVGGTLGITGLTTASGGLTVAGGQNLTLSSGIGTYSQTYVSTATGTDNVATWTVSNGNTGSTLTTVNAHNIALAGSPNSSGSDNVTNGVNFANVTPETGNTFNALNFGSGYSSLLQYGGNSLINGSGILQNAAIGSSTDYSSLNEVGALTSGSIASGFGTISTGNNITTTTEVQGGTVNATTNLDLNGVSINNTGTLSNVAYLPATTQTFTGANTFSASGTALSVTNNATISGTGTIGTLSVTSNGTVGGTLGITGLTTASGGLTVAGGQNLTLSSGIGTYSQTYVSTATGTDNVATWTVSNGNTGSTLTTVNAHNIALAGSPNSSGSDNVTNGVNFANVTPETGNTFNALNFGSGYSSLLQYGGNSLINGSGILQNAAIGSSTDYSSLNEVGALTSGSIASGFGTISTGNNITTTTEVQGGTVNATTNLDLNGVSINNTGTLSNVAYLPATTQTFTGANTFSASGTALSVTNNATISGTGTIGTLSVTSNGTVGGTLGITGLTTASGGLTVAGGQNLTLSSGIGTYSQTYVSTATGTDNVATWTVSNGNTGSTLTTVNAHNIALAGSPNSSGSDNVTNGVNFANVTPETGNTFNALNFGSGYSSLLQYGGNSLINGSGILQNAAIGSSTDYSSLNEVGALTSGSIASGFGTISTGNNITTTTEVQGGTVNATTNLDLNGVSINNTGTLSNVAYLPATTQTFTGANTFSASGTALSVTNNATISGTGTIGTLSVTSNGTVGGTLGITGLTTASGGLTVAGGQNLTLSSGIGTYSQTYVSTATGTDNVATWTVSNGNTGSTLTTVNAHNIALAGSPNSSGSDNVTNGVNFANVTPETGNTFNALNFGSGYSSLLQYGGNSLINGSGILQNAAIGSSTDYSSLNEVGALTSGSIASGFGTISTGNNITTTTEVQGGTVNATTNLDLNGVSINNTGTLSNVAYLPATTQTFTGANTFSASGTALSVTNNATISGTGTIGTLSVTSNGTVGGTLGITGLTTASGGEKVANTSTTAFQIQNAGGTQTLLAADTTSTDDDVTITTAATSGIGLVVNSSQSGISGLELSQLDANSCGSGSYCDILGVNSSGQVGLSNVAVSLTSPALAYWDGLNNPTTADQSYPTNPIATLTGNATYVGGGNGVELNPATANTSGSINWNFAQVPFEEIQFQFKAGGGSGADATWFYSYANAVPTTEFGTGMTDGYIIYFSEYHDCIGLTYGGFTDNNQCVSGGGTAGDPLAAYTMPAHEINDDNWHNVEIVIIQNRIEVYWDGNLVINYADVYTRDLSDYQDFGFGSRSGSSTDDHYIKGLLVTKLQNTSLYNIDTVSPIASDLWWNNGSTDLGVDTSSPEADLEVDGSTIISPTIDSTGTACSVSSTTSTTCETSGTSTYLYSSSGAFTSAMVGDTINFPSGVSTGGGESGVITAETSTHLTLSAAIAFIAGSAYTINYPSVEVNSSGEVGIGTSSPSYDLDVDGDSTGYVQRIDNTSTAATTSVTTSADGLYIQVGATSRNTGNYFVAFANGTGTGTVSGKIQGISGGGVTYSTSGADYAEWFDSNNPPSLGTIVSLDPNNSGGIVPSVGGANIVGIVSDNSGFVGNGPICKSTDSSCDADYDQVHALVGLTGQIDTNVSVANGPINVGDAIMPDPNDPGVGEKATSYANVVGYAEQATTTDRKILVFVQPGIYNPVAAENLQGGSASLDIKNLTVTGNADISGNLNVQNSITAGSISVGSASVSGNLAVAGTTSTTNLKVANLASLANVDISGQATFNAGIYLGAAVNTKQAIIKTFTSGQPISAGSVVVISSKPGQVVTTTTPDNLGVIGVAVDSASSAGKPIQVAIGGWVQVNVDTFTPQGGKAVPIVPGQILVTSPMAGAAEATTTPVAGSIIGKSTDYQSANNTVWVLITLL